MLNLNKASLVQISPKVTGHAFEQYVYDYLQTQGFQNVIQNFNCRLGEIDLIGTHQNQLLFIEVRFRKHLHYGGAAASVTYQKQQKIIRTAQFFLRSHPKWSNWACRFDVVAVTMKADKPEIEWIQNAFS